MLDAWRAQHQRIDIERESLPARGVPHGDDMSFPRNDEHRALRLEARPAQEFCSQAPNGGAGAPKILRHRRAVLRQTAVSGTGSHGTRADRPRKLGIPVYRFGRNSTWTPPSSHRLPIMQTDRGFWRGNQPMPKSKQSKYFLWLIDKKNIFLRIIWNKALCYWYILFWLADHIQHIFIYISEIINAPSMWRQPIAIFS